MAKIIDIILHKNKYSTQWCVVLDEPLKFLYERKGDFLIAEDAGFFSFYKYGKYNHINNQAFGGRKFDIPMKNGSVEKASGQWWHDMPDDYAGLLYSVGYGTVEGLEKCNVFYSGRVDPEAVDKWMAENEASNNYNKYAKNSADYGVQNIDSIWEAA